MRDFNPRFTHPEHQIKLIAAHGDVGQLRDRSSMRVKKNSGGGELKKLRSSMGTLYGEPLGLSLNTA